MVVCGQVSFLLSIPQCWSAGPGAMLEMDKERSSSVWARDAGMRGAMRKQRGYCQRITVREDDKGWMARLGHSSRAPDVRRAWCSLDFKQEGARCNFCFWRFCTFLDPGLKATTATPAPRTLSPVLRACLGFISLEALVSRVHSVWSIYLPILCLPN